MPRCDCELCKFHRRAKKVMKSRNPDKLIALVEEMLNAAADTDMDNDYYKAVLSGTWPSSVEILTKALEKAKVHERSEKMREKAEGMLRFPKVQVEKCKL